MKGQAGPLCWTHPARHQFCPAEIAPQIEGAECPSCCGCWVWSDDHFPFLILRLAAGTGDPKNYGLRRRDRDTKHLA